MAMPTAYNPNSYAPTNVTNGTSGSTTPESQRNAAMQIPQSGSTSNPYAEAVTHTLNWMQYQIPQQGQSQAVPVDQMQAAMNNYQKAVPQATPQSAPVMGATPESTLGSTSEFDQGGGPNGNGGTGGTPPTTGGTTPATPGGTGTGGGRGGGRPSEPGGGRPNEPIDPAAWMQEHIDNYAKMPGFEWVGEHPEAFHMFAAEQQRNGTMGNGPTFEEWLTTNWEDVSAKLKLTPEQQRDWGYAVRQKGYDSWATRLRNDYKNGGGKDDVQWVDAKTVQDYDQWLRWARSTKGEVKGLSFWEWAGSVNKGIDPVTGKPIPKPTDEPPKEPLPGSRIWGNRNSETTPGTGTYNDPNQSLENLIRSLRDQGANGRDAALRQFRHEAGLTGLNDMGAYNPALGTLIQDSIRDENSAIYEIINAKDEGERNRALQKYLGELGAKSQVDSASIGASASNYDSDMRYKLGLAGFDVDRENNWWRNQLSMQDQIYRYLQMIYGSSPDGILGGNPVPPGDGY